MRVGGRGLLAPGKNPDFQAFRAVAGAGNPPGSRCRRPIHASNSSASGPPSGMVSGTSGPNLREWRARARLPQNAPPAKDVPPESRLGGRLEIKDAIFHGAAHATGEAGAALLDWPASLDSAGLAMTAGT